MNGMMTGQAIAALIAGAAASSSGHRRGHDGGRLDCRHAPADSGPAPVRTRSASGSGVPRRTLRNDRPGRLNAEDTQEPIDG